LFDRNEVDAIEWIEIWIYESESYSVGLIWAVGLTSSIEYRSRIWFCFCFCLPTYSWI
jgi:hypothetical protein